MNGKKVYGPIMPGENQRLGQGTFAEKLRFAFSPGKFRIKPFSEK
jgi:hypothetical protein